MPDEKKTEPIVSERPLAAPIMPGFYPSDPDSEIASKNSLASYLRTHGGPGLPRMQDVTKGSVDDAAGGKLPPALEKVRLEKDLWIGALDFDSLMGSSLYTTGAVKPIRADTLPEAAPYLNDGLMLQRGSIWCVSTNEIMNAQIEQPRKERAERINQAVMNEDKTIGGVDRSGNRVESHMTAKLGGSFSEKASRVS